MGGGGGGGGGNIPSYSRPADEKLEQKEADAAKRTTEKIAYTTMKEKEEILCKQIKEKIKENIEKIDWTLNDHGIMHLKRTIKNIKEISELFDKNSISKELIHEKLSDYDKEILDYAARLHDIGRISGKKGSHAVQSANEIKKIKNIFPNKDSQDLVALLAKLHNLSGIRNLGGKSLKDLINKGRIDVKTAYLASILTVADAVDLGEQRIKTNSQGVPKSQVIERIKKELPKYRQESRLSHFYGHEGINNVKLSFDNKNVDIRIKLNDKKIKKYGPDVASRVKDFLRDYNSTTVVSSQKGQYNVKFVSKDPISAEEWYNKHELILSDEIKSKPKFIKA
ncbi:MAG: HD domain-containing protein [Candidatus Helarchaeota archaeon]